MLQPHRGEADPAVAEYRSRDAVPARGHQQRIPHRLSVIVRGRVHPSWRHQEPRRGDLAAARTLPAAHAHDTLAVDGQVPGEGRLAGSINDSAAANDDIVHGTNLLINRVCPAMLLPDADRPALASRRAFSYFTPILFGGIADHRSDCAAPSGDSNSVR